MKKLVTMMIMVTLLMCVLVGCGEDKKTDTESKTPSTKTEVSEDLVSKNENPTTVEDSPTNVEPTIEPTVEPTIEITPTTEPTPTIEATPEPTMKPTATPTPEVKKCTNHKMKRTKSIQGTCVAKGQFEEQCEVCGYINAWEGKIKENNHTEGDWIVDVDAAEGEVGIVSKKCVDCKETLDRIAFRRVNGEVVLFTWRQTTDEKCLYWSDEERANAGLRYMGEDFSEVIQMMDDPTITFDEEHFYDGSVFEGCTRKHVEYFIENNYTLDSLCDLIEEANFNSVLEYFESIGKPLEK